VTNKSTLIGFLVLVLVAGGVYLARRSPVPSQGAAAGQASGDEALPDVTLADGTVDLGDVRIVMSLAQRPPVAFARTRVLVRAEQNGSAVALAGGMISFEMAMPMGDYRYSLVPAAQGWYAAGVPPPPCSSGPRRWYATIEGAAAGRSRTARFRLDVTPPAPAPAP
jgi:hypothetical protein